LFGAVEVLQGLLGGALAEVAALAEDLVSLGLARGLQCGDFDPVAQLAQADCGASRFLVGAACADALDGEAHQGLVDGAYLLDREIAVADALAVQDDQRVQDFVEGAVIDGGEAHLGALFGDLDGGGPLGHAAFQEGVGAGIEEAALAGGQAQTAMLDAEIDGAKEADERAVPAVALMHRLGVGAGVVAEALVEAEHAEVLGIGVVLDRQQASVFGVEEKHQAKDDVEDALVDVACFHGGAHPVGSVAATTGRGVADGGGLVAGEQTLDALEDLLGQGLGDVGLAATGFCEQALERVFGVGCVGAARMKEELERLGQGAAGGIGEVLDAEGEV